MAIGRAIWSGLPAFDRIGRRFPRIVQTLVIEPMAGLTAGAFQAKLVEHGGTTAWAGSGPVATFWVVFGPGPACPGWLLRDMFRPRPLRETRT